jgi:YVTN family beta-propeller protein
MLRFLVIVVLMAACHAQKSTLLVLNKADNELAFVDPESLRILGKVPTGVGPHEIAVSADGKTAYVANYGNQQPGNSLSIIDIGRRAAIRKVDLGPLLRPHGIFEHAGNIYFTAEGSRAVARYNLAKEKVDWSMGTGQAITHMLVVSGDRIYTSNIAAGTVTFIDTKQAAGSAGMQHIAIGKGPEGMDLSPDGKTLWVATREDGNLHLIDTATNTLKKSFPVGNFPIRVKVTPDGKRVLVSNAAGGDVAILDAETQQEIKRIAIGDQPVGILITPDGKWAFVAASESGKVIRLDLTKLALAGQFQPGNAPDGLGWSTIR